MSEGASRDTLMRELEDQVQRGVLTWLVRDYGYRVEGRRWPVLTLKATWTVIELAFEPTGTDGELAVGVRVGGVGMGPPTPVHAVGEGLSPGDDVVTVDRSAGVRGACESISELLEQVTAVVSGDLSALGGGGAGVNRPPSSSPGAARATGLETPLTDDERTALMATVRSALASRLPWLAAAPGLLDLELYGLHHGEPPPVLRADAGEPGGLRVRLVEGVVAVDPERAVDELAPVLEAARALLSGDADAWSAERRRDNERQARRALEDELDHGLPRAKEAFRAHDYARVVELLGPLEGFLSRTDQHKLEYARRHC